jgi:hypothetical protein
MATKIFFLIIVTFNFIKMGCYGYPRRQQKSWIARLNLVQLSSVGILGLYTNFSTILLYIIYGHIGFVKSALGSHDTLSYLSLLRSLWCTFTSLECQLPSAWPIFLPCYAITLIIPLKGYFSPDPFTGLLSGRVSPSGKEEHRFESRQGIRHNRLQYRYW